MYTMNPMLNQVAPTPAYSMPMGRWTIVNSFNDVQTMPVPADGTQMLFMLKDEPVLYMVSMTGGQRMIQAFSIAPLVIEPTKNENNENSLESRIGRLELSISKLMDALGEKKE